MRVPREEKKKKEEKNHKVNQKPLMLSIQMFGLLGIGVSKVAWLEAATHNKSWEICAGWRGG